MCVYYSRKAQIGLTIKEQNMQKKKHGFGYFIQVYLVFLGVSVIYNLLDNENNVINYTILGFVFSVVWTIWQKIEDRLGQNNDKE